MIAAVLGALAVIQPPAPPPAGRYTLTLTIDPPSGSTRTLTGTVTLDPAAPGAVASTGRYQMPFTATDPVPDHGAAMARRWPGDSLKLVLRPSIRETRAELAGRWGPAGVEGRWRWVGSTTGGGRFTLRPR